MIQKMGEKEVGEGRVESIGQHTSRAKALLRMLSAEGWTRDDIDNKSFQSVLDLIEAAFVREEISRAMRQALRGTAKKYGFEIGYFQGV